MSGETYNSTLDLRLPQQPIGIADPSTNEALIDIHNAIFAIAEKSDGLDVLLAYLAKQRSVRILQTDGDIVTTDGTILIDSSVAQVTALLHTAVGYTGYMYSVACVNDSYGSFLDMQSGETLSGAAGPFELYEDEYLNVVSDGNNWIVAR